MDNAPTDLGASVARVYDRVPPDTLEDLWWKGRVVALRVTRSNCPACDRLKDPSASRQRLERGLEADAVVPWDVSRSEQKLRVVTDAGVTRVPSYLVLDDRRGNRATRVVGASQSV